MRHKYGIILLLLVLLLGPGAGLGLANPAAPLAPPMAAFSAEPPEGCAPLPVQFTDESIGSPPVIFWLWQFGDGITSTLQHPSHTYTATDTYLTRLTVMNQNFQTDTVTATINVYPAPLARFDYDPASGLVPLMVQFTNTSAHVISPSWDFGDGTTDLGDQVSHTYNESGDYSVTLAVTSAFGCGRVTTTAGVQVQQCIPVEILAVTATTALSGCGALFETELSGTAPFSYSWDFGPWGSSQEPTPWVALISGTHTYTLTVLNCGGTYSHTLTGTVTIVCEPVFFLAPLSLTVTLNPGLSATRYLTVGNAGNLGLTWTLVITPSVDWLVADPLQGNLPPGQDTLVRLALDAANQLTGTYAAALEVNSSDPQHPHAVVSVTLVVTSACLPLENLAFDWEPAQPWIGTLVTYTARAEGSVPISYSWAFGDGNMALGGIVTHTYAQTGSYMVVLTASNCSSPSVVLTDTLIVQSSAPCKPVQDVDLNWQPTTPTVGAVVTLTAEVFPPSATDPIIRWAFGDGGSGEGNCITHSYGQPGAYTVVVTASNCLTASASNQASLVVITACMVPQSIDFTWAPQEPMMGLPVFFTATFAPPTATEPDEYLWDLGDGSLDSGPVVSHIYWHTGTYTVVLTATSCDSSTLVASRSMNVVPCEPLSEVDFNWQPLNPVMGERVTFSGEASGSAPISFSWDLGDGSPLIRGQTVDHIYSVEGGISVTMSAANFCSGPLHVDKEITVRRAYIYLPLLYRNFEYVYWGEIDLSLPEPPEVRSLLTLGPALHVGTNVGVLQRDNCSGPFTLWNQGEWIILDMVADGNTIYAGSFGGGVWKWEASSWSQLPQNGLGDPYVWDVEIGLGGELLAGTDTGVYAWSGTTWTPMTAGLPNPVYIDVLGYGEVNQLYVGTWGNGVYHWNGAAWESFWPAGGISEGADRIWSIVFDSSTLYAGTEAGVYARQGSGWVSTGLNQWKVYNLLYNSNVDMLYAATSGDGVYVKTAAGGWKALPELPEEARFVYTLALSQDCSELYVGTKSGGLWATSAHPGH